MTHTKCLAKCMTQNKHSINTSFIFFPIEVRQLENKTPEAQNSRSFSKMGALYIKADKHKLRDKGDEGHVCLAQGQHGLAKCSEVH